MEFSVVLSRCFRIKSPAATQTYFTWARPLTIFTEGDYWSLTLIIDKAVKRQEQYKGEEESKEPEGTEKEE